MRADQPDPIFGERRMANQNMRVQDKWFGPPQSRGKQNYGCKGPRTLSGEAAKSQGRNDEEMPRGSSPAISIIHPNRNNLMATLSEERIMFLILITGGSQSQNWEKALVRGLWPVEVPRHGNLLKPQETPHREESSEVTKHRR